MKSRYFMFVLAAMMLWMPSSIFADKSDPQVKAQEWFQDARFGLFVHWGVYSLLSKGEWVMNNDKIAIQEYEKLYPQFNPVKFNADKWVDLVKTAGMKYITITSKHHDGFCMFDTALTDYKITNTPFGRDVMAELAKACKKKGIKLFFYYSQLDWHHPDYFPRGRTGHDAGRAESGDWSRYLQYYEGHMRELCANYGKIGGLWFDGLWDKPDADWNNDGIYHTIHSLQPQALIGSNHHVAPYPGEGFQMFEQDLPGENTAGFNKAGVSQLPLETCLTMNNSWGYNKDDHKYKSVKEIVHYLVKAAGFGANLLLNVGPMPTGEIQPEFQERLIAVGQWLKENGKTIYKTRRGPFVKQEWGTSTRKGDIVYLHILKSPGASLKLPAADFAVQSARVFKGKKLQCSTNTDGTEIALPPIPEDSIDVIIELKVKSN
ncbi:MAG: alpha-L-fucosidase [Candidatus Omnitrophota bacterium]